VNEKNISNFESYLKTREKEIETAIHDLWQTRDEKLWQSHPHFYTRLGEIAYNVGQTMFSHDILKEGLEHFPENLRLNQLYALSLIKCGFLENARELLTRLEHNGYRDEETLDILGRVYKDMWVVSGGISGDRSLLKKSHISYMEAFRGSGGFYSGINAASLSYMFGELDIAKKLARKVLSICMQRLKANEPDYWTLATVGEGLVLLHQFEKAFKYFTLAKKLARKNYSYLASTRKQLVILSDYIDIPDFLLKTVAVPPVIAFTGHMLDRPGPKTPRFPQEIALQVKKEITARLDLLEAGIGYSSAACGSDVLFLESMQERKAETNVVLPFDREEFFNTSVNFAGAEWNERVNNALKNSLVIYYATEGKYLGDDLLFDYTNRMIMGKTLLRSEMLETEPVLVAVWDGKKDNQPGGTGSFIRLWDAQKLRKEIISLKEILQSFSPVNTTYVNKPYQPESLQDYGYIKKVRRSVKALLFADLAGFSTIKEEQMPFFIENYLGKIGEHLKRTSYRPRYKNIWGDAFYFVFDDILSAAHYAIELRDLVNRLEWSEIGLPRNLSLRIGLHAGPVFQGKEPILKKTNFFGTHVNRAARIEPITSPGNVYASEQFAAMVKAMGTDELVSRYVGIIVLPKKFGKYPIYHIKRKNDIE